MIVHFNILNWATQIPFEDKPENTVFELWAPNSCDKENKIYSVIYHNGRWCKCPPLEYLRPEVCNNSFSYTSYSPPSSSFSRTTTTTTSSSSSSHHNVVLHFLDLEFIFPFSEPIDDKSYNVLIQLKQYVIQPISLNCKDKQVLQDVAVFCMFNREYINGYSTERYSKFHTEMRWFSSNNPIENELLFNHQLIQVTVGEEKKKKNKEEEGVKKNKEEKEVEKYWNEQLKLIYDEFLNKEPNKNNLVPFSIAVNGVPVTIKITKDDNKSFDMNKGVSPQSYWMMPSSSSQVLFTEGWYKQRLIEVLGLRDCPVKKFMSVCTNLFNNNKQSEEDKMEIHLCLADIIRVATCYSQTQPWVADRRFRYLNKEKNKIKQLRFDCYHYESVRTIWNDCEDSVRFVYDVLSELLRMDLTKIISPEVKMMRRVAAYIGIPIGISGLSCNPDSPQDDTCYGHHMFGACIPHPVFTKMIGAEDKDEKEIKDHFCRQFGFDTYPKQFYLHNAMLEGTLVGTPYVCERETVSEEKKKFRKEIISTMMKDTSVCHWKKWTVFCPFSSDPDHGVVTIHECTRAFTFAYQLFYPNEFLKRKKLLTVGSFSMNTGLTENSGIPGQEFFAKIKNLNEITWKLRVSCEMPEKVFKAEKLLLDQFNRPFITMKEEERISYSKQGHIDGKNRNSYVMVFVLNRYLNEFIEETRKHEYKVFATRPYGAGHGTVVFISVTK